MSICVLVCLYVCFFFNKMSTPIHFAVKSRSSAIRFLIGPRSFYHRPCFPTEILSLAKGKPTFGIASGEVITELSCQKVTGRVLPSLAFDNGRKFSLLPLVDIGPDHSGNPRSGQLVSPNFVIQGRPTYYENYHSGRTLIFRVNSRYILYKNYIATHFNLPVSLLHVPLTTIKDNFYGQRFLFSTPEVCRNRKWINRSAFAFICYIADGRRSRSN